jgi:tRNA A-37 threonylcarbamoyl transferase component Bud32
MTPSPASATNLQPGDLIGGCVIEAFIAEGGMGSVYRARKELLDRTVAVKVLHPRFAEEKDLLARFLREAKLASTLEHPNLIRFFDVGEEGGRYFITMEYVEGRDLRAILDAEGPFPVGRALSVIRQVADGLAYAHERGIIHRDIKPANIMMARSGDVKITDLGLARPLGEDSEVTFAGQILGTPVYMSPEQCRGEAADVRSDLYALGATLYTLLSGRKPFQGKTPAILIHQVVHEAPPPLRELIPEIPEGVAALVQRLMAKHPVARYQTAQEVADAIKETTARRFVLAGEAPRRDRERRGEKRGRAAPPARIAALIVAGAGLGLLVWKGFGEDRAGAAAPVAREVDHEVDYEDDGEDGREIVPDGGRIVRRVKVKSEGGEGEDGEDEGWEQDPRLDERVAALQESIVRGEYEDLSEFFLSSEEGGGDDLALPRVLADLTARGLEPVGFYARPEGANEARVTILFKTQSGRSIGLPMQWQLEDGEWYIKPRRFRPGDR